MERSSQSPLAKGLLPAELATSDVQLEPARCCTSSATTACVVATITDTERRQALERRAQAVSLKHFGVRQLPDQAEGGGTLTAFASRPMCGTQGQGQGGGRQRFVARLLSPGIVL